MISFPRHLFKKRKVVNSLDEMVGLINTYNGRQDIFLSLYSFTLDGFRASYENSEIDKILFDFDSAKGFENVCKFHKYLMEQNIRHKVLFTGRGFHLYVHTNGKNIKNKKHAISALQHELANKVGLKIGDPKTADIDNHIVGDIARIARFPNTINMKSGLYCILLENGFDKLTSEDIKEKAKQPNHPKDFVFGTHLIELSKYDKEKETVFLEKQELVSSANIVENWAPCIKHLLSKGDCGWRDRYYIILYFRDIGLTQSETLNMLKKYLSPEKFKHCVYDERQVDSLYRKSSEYYMSVDDIKDHGCCFNCKECPIAKMYKDWK